MEVMKGIVTIDKFGVTVSPANCMKCEETPRESLLKLAISLLKNELKEKYIQCESGTSPLAYQEIEDSILFEDDYSHIDEFFSGSVGSSDPVCYSWYEYLYSDL